MNVRTVRLDVEGCGARRPAGDPSLRAGEGEVGQLKHARQETRALRGKVAGSGAGRRAAIVVMWGGESSGVGQVGDGRCGGMPTNE